MGDPGESEVIQLDNGMATEGTLWGLPLAVTSAIAEGTALVGAFDTGGYVAMREGMRLETSNSDNQDFQSNRIAIRAGLRAAMCITSPLAFCSVTGIA